MRIFTNNQQKRMQFTILLTLVVFLQPSPSCPEQSYPQHSCKSVWRCPTCASAVVAYVCNGGNCNKTVKLSTKLTCDGCNEVNNLAKLSLLCPHISVTSRWTPLCHPGGHWRWWARLTEADMRRREQMSVYCCNYPPQYQQSVWARTGAGF